MNFEKFLILLLSLLVIVGIPVYVSEKYNSWRNKRELKELDRERKHLVQGYRLLKEDYEGRASFRERGYMLENQINELRKINKSIARIDERVALIDGSAWNQMKTC